METGQAGGAIETLASVVPERVLVVGSLPPAGRDIDVLASPEAQQAIRQGLHALGWTVRGSRCVRFERCSAVVVELVSARDLGLADSTLGSLFAEAGPLSDSPDICAPAPKHALLILAQRLARGDGRLSAKHRRRLDGYLRADPSLWDAAARIADDWGTARALSGLRGAYESGTRMSRRRRAAAVREALGKRGDGWPGALAKGWRIATGWQPRSKSFIVALSGLDGAGKSSQAAALGDALGRLGFEVDVRWTSLADHRGFPQLLRSTADRLLTLARSHRSDGHPDVLDDDPRPTRGGTPPPLTAAKRLRQSSRLVAFVWTSLVAIHNGLDHRRATRSRHSRGRVVICDRYLLDSKVALPYEYGPGRNYRFQSWLVRALTPSPDRSYLLAVSPETASRRKSDYTEDENRRRALLYDRECESSGVRRVDGERPPSEICAQLAADVWTALEERGRH